MRTPEVEIAISNTKAGMYCTDDADTLAAEVERLEAELAKSDEAARAAMYAVDERAFLAECAETSVKRAEAAEARVRELEAHLKGSMQSGGYEHFVKQLRNAQRQAHNAMYVAEQLEKKVEELEALDELTTNQAKEYLARAEAAEARVRELEAQLNKRIDAYMNEPHCCSGRECGCMGVTRFEQIVGEELGQRMATMREKNARLRAALGTASRAMKDAESMIAAMLRTDDPTGYIVTGTAVRDNLRGAIKNADSKQTETE